MRKKLKDLSKWAGFVFILLAVGFLISCAQKIPSPEKILGFKVGADFHLASYQQASAYFKALEKASPKIKIFELGKTSTGQPMIGAIITSVENMAKLDHFKEISRKLALAKGLTDDEARSLASEGKAVVYIDGGLHATEVAPAQDTIKLAHYLLSSESSDVNFILDNVILLLVFANPDGMDLVAEWYNQNVGTSYEVSPLPWLYNKYVGHDNNRDSFMVNMVETQNLTRLSHEWYPLVIYNGHQKGPFPARIFIPPNAEPVNPNYHPLLMRGKNLVGSAMGYAFDQEGKAGAISGRSYDLWYPGYVDQVGDFFNTISILTECQLYNYATPRFYTIDEFPKEFQDLTASVFYPNPWKGGWWRLGDAVEYCFTAARAVLNTAAKYRAEFLFNKYKMGKDMIARFQKEAPYAWVIPQQQWDAPTAALLLNKMKLLGIEVFEAEKPFISDDISYPAGTWVIPMSQPFANFVKSVFEVQNYPDLTKYPALWQGVVRPQEFPGAYLPPYDIAGWTLPYQMGVKAVASRTPIEATLIPVDKAVPPAGKVESGAGYAYLLSPRPNNGFIAVNRILKEGGEVLRARESFSAGGKDYSPGTYVVLSQTVAASSMESLAKDLYLDVGSAGSAVPVKASKLRTPRVALYKPWTASMDEGWTRWLLEQFEFPFSNIFDAEIRAGDLGQRFDVLVIPSMSVNEIVGGNRPGTIPPQYAGGMSERGIENIRKFIEGGGTLVLLNYSTLLAPEKLNLPVDNVLNGLGTSEFICPGSVLRMNFNPNHPVAYGMPEEAPAMFIQSPAFSTRSQSGEAPETIAKYPGGDLLMSGWLKGEKYLQNRASSLDVSLGKGRVVLLGFGVQQRGQPHGTFKLLFNSLYYAVME